MYDIFSISCKVNVPSQDSLASFLTSQESEKKVSQEQQQRLEIDSKQSINRDGKEKEQFQENNESNTNFNCNKHNDDSSSGSLQVDDEVEKIYGDSQVHTYSKIDLKEDKESNSEKEVKTNHDLQEQTRDESDSHEQDIENGGKEEKIPMVKRRRSNRKRKINNMYSL